MYLVEFVSVFHERIFNSVIGIYENKQEAIEKIKDERSSNNNNPIYIFLIDDKKFISNKNDFDSIEFKGYKPCNMFRDSYFATIREVNLGYIPDFHKQILGKYDRIETKVVELQKIIKEKDKKI